VRVHNFIFLSYNLFFLEHVSHHFRWSICDKNFNSIGLTVFEIWKSWKKRGGGTLKIEQKQKKIILSTYKATTPVSQRPGKNFKNKKDSGKNLKKTNQTRIVYRRNWKRIFSDNQEKQKSEKNAGKIVDYRNAYLYLWILSSFDCTLSFFTHLLEYYRVCLLVNLAVKKIQFRWKLLKNNIL
jgi:hypothetical protein